MKKWLIMISLTALILCGRTMLSYADTEYIREGVTVVDTDTGCRFEAATIVVEDDPHGAGAWSTAGSKETIVTTITQGNVAQADIVTTESGSKGGADVINKAGSTTTTIQKDPGGANTTYLEDPAQNIKGIGAQADHPENSGNGKDTGGKGYGAEPDMNGGKKNGTLSDGKDQGIGSDSGNQTTQSPVQDNRWNWGQNRDDLEKKGEVNYIYIQDSKDAPASSVPGGITGVTADYDGNIYITVTESDGKTVSMPWNEYWTYVFTQTVVDQDGLEITKTESVVSASDILEEWTYLYTQWSIMNMTNAESKYYGGYRNVLRTFESRAKIQPDYEGTYKVLGTPWFHVRYYRIVTRCDDDDCWEEEVTIKVANQTKAPEEFTVNVPLICTGCPVPTMCINGGCDPEKDLYTVADEKHEPGYVYDQWVERIK